MSSITKAATTTRRSALTHRLKDVVIWELRSDGNTRARRMTLRDLYEHILGIIVKQSKDAASSSSSSDPLAPPGPPSKKGIARLSSTGTTGTVDTAGTNPSDADTNAGENPKPEKKKKAKRLGGYLHPRDLRKMMTPLSLQNEPEIMVRRHVILLNFDHLKAVVLRDRIMVPVPNGDTTTLIELERRITRGSADSLFDEDGVDAGEDFGGGKEVHWPPTEKDNTSAGNTATIAATTTSDVDTKKSSGDHTDDVIMKQVDAVDGLLEDIEEWAEMANQSWVNLPFELQCVDAVLTANVQLISKDISSLTDEIYEIVEKILSPDRSSVEIEQYRDRLRQSKNDAGEILLLAQSFTRAIQQVLNEDEDMCLMQLSHLLTRPERFIQPVSEAILEEESDEPELILESHLQQGLSTNNACDYLKTVLINTDELIDQKLDTIRNRLLYINTIIGLLSFIVGTGSLVGSFFGMNLTNFLEDDDNAFRQVVIGTMVGLLGLLIFLIWIFIRVGGLPKSI